MQEYLKFLFHKYKLYKLQGKIAEVSEEYVFYILSRETPNLEMVFRSNKTKFYSKSRIFPHIILKIFRIMTRK
jgi:hypothetical protein